MCGAFVYIHSKGSRYQPMESGIGFSGVDELIGRKPHLGLRYNIRPSQDVVAIVSTGGGPIAMSMRWGLIPSWAKSRNLPVNTFNARDDRLTTSRMWRKPFEQSRAIVLASGFFEWASSDGTKRPMYITRQDDRKFAFAALCDFWTNGQGQTVESCAIITTAANEFMSDIHHRMPAILSDETAALWLDPATTKADSLQPILMPSPSDLLKVHPVSTAVNSYLNDDSSLIDDISVVGHQSDVNLKQLDLFGDEQIK